MAEPFRVTAPLLLASSLGPPMTTRLEPQSLSGDPQSGLAAQLWDPLWLLGRQWQVGEFAGEDTGAPLTVTIRAELEPLVAWHPGPIDTDTGADGWLPLDRGQLLESLVDAEPPSEPSGRGAAYAGWALLDTLADLGEARAVAELRRRFPSPSPDPAADPSADPGRAVVPDAWSPVAALAAGRGISAERAARAFEAGAPARPSWWRTSLRAGPGRREAAEEALAGWLGWYRSEVAPPQPPHSSWVGPRLEYEFAVATQSAVLRAPVHPGGEIGWSSFDIVPGAVPPALGGQPLRMLERTVVATPLTFPGMPASRFWELEDARVDLGSVWADPHELARLLVVECALVYGGDWLVVPLDVPAGGIARVGSVTYADTFGTTWVVEEAVPDDPTSWRMYAVTAAHAAGDQLSGLLVPPASPGRLEGPAVEEVAFLRDEAANMVWAIEHVVPGPGGDPAVPRAQPAPEPHRPEPVDGEPVLAYTLMTQVPATWTPYLPRLGVLTGDAGAAPRLGVALVRGRVPRFDLAGEAVEGGPAGTLLDSEEHRLVDSAEVPRQGVRVRRVPVVARRGDGSPASWTARRVMVGRGEGESGLRFDHVHLPRPR